MIPRRVYATLLLALSVRGQQDTTKPDIDPETLQADMITANLMSHLSTLQEVADANGGNRAFGMPGYQASVDYVWGQISNIPGTKVWKQDFPANFSWSEAELRIGESTNVPVYAIERSPTTPDTGIEAELVAGPEGPAGCNETAYDNLNVTGKIVLVERGACDAPDGTPIHGGKVIAAARAGAVAVIQYQDTPNEPFSPSFPEELPDYVPAGSINQANGQNLKDRLASGETLQAYFRQDQIREVRITQNIFAETEGDSDSVIMLGGHLDSVQTGPGINDNGSGVSLVIELFRSVAKYRTKNKLRFAWWGAEENAGLGSRSYCYNLTEFPAEANKVVAYLNFDMVSRGTYYVGDGDASTGAGYPIPPGSDVIESLWLDYFQSIGITAQEKKIGFDSDHFFFQVILEKPVGLLFTGSNVTEDPCYHKACDRIDNVNPEMLTTNARAAAYMAAVLAINGTDLLPASSLGGAKLKRSLDDWAAGYSGCGHGFHSH
ncbi:hypothetical protein QBC34DRAFT_214702 [Podospora aff. communis PSN243]|uniref:Peptide hydrolase n=1 Tax=Podospora aff. communis PSN243 TaxID=3040156 RepID=A0AAV9G6L8_9PEZI|nr:hypothetical protein QBC34DRAFT_214702 [Podospora aff. communis PSN243]